MLYYLKFVLHYVTVYFPLHYVLKMSLRRCGVVLKSLKTPLRNLKMAYRLSLEKILSSKKFKNTVIKIIPP